MFLDEFWLKQVFGTFSLVGVFLKDCRDELPKLTGEPTVLREVDSVRDNSRQIFGLLEVEGGLTHNQLVD